MFAEDISRRVENLEAVTSGYYDFFSICAQLSRQQSPSDFPLHRAVILRSEVVPVSPGEECRLEVVFSKEKSLKEYTLILSFMTLAGVSGPLPWWVTDHIIRSEDQQGESLHSFLDILNRRFWELLFLTGRLASSPFFGASENIIDEILHQLPYGLVAVDEKFFDITEAHAKSYGRQLKSQFFENISGSGEFLALIDFFSKNLKSELDVIQHRLVNLPIARRSISFLGAAVLGSDNAVIGSSAASPIGLEFRIRISPDESLDCFCSSNALENLAQLVRIHYGLCLPPVNFYLHCPAEDDFSKLGYKSCRMGFGAMIKSNYINSQIFGPFSLTVSS